MLISYAHFECIFLSHCSILRFTEPSCPSTP